MRRYGFFRRTFQQLRRERQSTAVRVVINYHRLAITHGPFKDLDTNSEKRLMSIATPSR
jgi:hypothetical protein